MVESGVEMNKTAADSARRSPHPHCRFARFGEIGIGVNDARANKGSRDRQSADQEYRARNTGSARHESVIVERACACQAFAAGLNGVQRLMARTPLNVHAMNRLSQVCLGEKILQSNRLPTHRFEPLKRLARLFAGAKRWLGGIDD